MHLLKEYLTHQNLSTYRLDGFSTFKFIFMVSHMSAGNIKCLADVQSTFRNRISTEWHWNLNIYEIQTLGNFEHCFSIYKWSSYLLPLWLFQIMEVKRCLVAATGLCEGESGHYGKEESEALDLLPARYWNSRVPWTVSSSTSLTGCLHLSAWQEETPQARSRWTASMCGARSGELGRFLLSRSVTGLEGEVGCSPFQTLPHPRPMLALSSYLCLLLVGAPASSISPLLLWHWELKEKEIASVISTQICSPSIPLFCPPSFASD